MNKLLKAASALVCALGLTSLASAQMTTVTASKISMGGIPISAGTVTFTPVNAMGVPIAFATGGGGLNSPTAFSCSLTAGAITGSCQIPDAALTSPANILYAIQITNTATQKAFTLQAVANITGDTWALDAYGPPASTSGVQTVQASIGSVVPSTCVMPSVFTKTSSPTGLYYCLNGTFVASGNASGGTTYTGTSPINVLDGAVSIQTATDSQAGAMSATDHAALTTVQTTANAALLKSGGAMTGPLSLAADPVSALQAATKNYVDAHSTGGTTPAGTSAVQASSADGTTLMQATSSQMQAAIGAGVYLPDAPLGTIHLNAGAGLNLIGDSTCEGAAADVNERSWGYMVGNAFAVGGSSLYCQGGDQMADGARKFLTGAVNRDLAAQVSIVQEGINDANAGTAANANQQLLYTQFAYTNGIYAATPFSALYHGNDSARLTKTGTWTLDSALGVNVGAATSVAGGTISFSITTTGGPIYVAQRVWNSDTGTNTVTIDGSVATDSITGVSTLSNGPLNGAVLSTQNGITDSVSTARFPVAAGTHTVVYTCVTVGTHGCSFTWAATPQPLTSYQGPVLLMAGVPRQAGDALATTTAAYDAINLAVATQLKSDGLASYFSNIRAKMNLATDWSTTGGNISGLAVADAAMTSGSKTFTSATAAFNANMVKQFIVIPSMVSGGVGFTSTIEQYVNATTVTLSKAATATVSGATAYIGTLDQVITVGATGTLHFNSNGHKHIFESHMDVLNSTTVGHASYGNNYFPSSIDSDSYQTAGEANDTSGNTLNQGWCSYKVFGQGYACFGWGGPTLATYAAGGFIALTQTTGTGGAASNFAIFPKAAFGAHTVADLGTSIIDINASGLYLGGAARLSSTGYNVNIDANCIVTGANSGCGMHNFLRQASWWNGTAAQKALITETFTPTTNNPNPPISQTDAVSNCGTSGCTWSINGYNWVNFGEPLIGTFHGVPVGAVLASASTIAPTSGLHHVSGTASISIITAPVGFSSTVGGCITLIADGAWSTVMGGNIFAAMTAVAGTPYQACYDGTEWYVK